MSTEAVEFGFKAAERGWNLERTLIEFAAKSPVKGQDYWRDAVQRSIKLLEHVAAGKSCMIAAGDLHREFSQALAAAPAPPQAGWQPTYDERVEMLRLADDIEGGEVWDLDQPQSDIIVRALRHASGELVIADHQTTERK